MLSPSRCRPAPSTARAVRCLLVVALVVGAAACGDDDDGVTGPACASGGVAAGDRPDEAPDVPDDPAALFDEAIERTTAMTSVVAGVRVDLEGPTFTGRLQADAEIVGEGPLRVVADATDGGETTVCSDGETVWFHVDDPRFDDALPDGVRWVSADLAELRDRGLLYDIDEVWAALPILRGVDEVDDLGTDEVDGVPVRVLAGEADFEAALEASSDDEREGLLGTISTGGADVDYEVEVALDGDDVVRRLVIRVEGTADGPDGDDLGAVGLVMQIDVRGVNPDIGSPTPPDGDETVPLDEVPDVEQLLAGF